MRRPGHCAAAATAVRHAGTTLVAASGSETFNQKLHRWLDVTGFLTRWHSRRAWILDLDPPNRTSMIMVTEYERKLLLWLTWVNYLFIPISLWYWYGQFTHLSSKPPIPLMPEYMYMNNRKPDFARMDGLSGACPVLVRRPSAATERAARLQR